MIIYRAYFAVLIIVGTAIQVEAQQLVTGRLVDKETGKPVKEATISVVGREIKTTSNAMGFFQLKIDTVTIIVVDSQGYETVELTVPETNFKVALSKTEPLAEPTEHASRIDTRKNLDLVEGQYVTSFIILDEKKEEFLTNCLIKWGDPPGENTGIIKWTGVNVPSIGESLTIKLLDGYLTKVGNFKRADKFESLEQKKKIIHAMAKDQERLISITVFTATGQSFDWTDNQVIIMKNYLAELFAK